MKKSWKNILILILAGILAVTAKLHGQSWSGNPYGFNFSGFVKTNASYDTRDVITADEMNFFLWPADICMDEEGFDINDNPSLNLLSIQAIAKGIYTVRDVGGAAFKAHVEGAFHGSTTPSFSRFYLRKAYAELEWEKIGFMVGHYWHPFFTEDNFPGTLSFNSGVPFQPYSRNPQVRISFIAGELRLILTALAQKDYTRPGGLQTFLHTGMPEFHSQLVYHWKNSVDNTEFMFGFGGGYKLLQPSIIADSSYHLNSYFGSGSLQTFIKAASTKFTVKIQATYGQNMYDLYQISSYAVLDKHDDLSEERTWSPMSNYSVWTDIHSNGKLELGIFGGYTENTGTGYLLPDKELMFQSYHAYSYAGDRCEIEHIWKLAPRIVFNTGSMKIGAEFDVTSASIGTFSNSGIVEKAKDVMNMRGMLSMTYSF